MEDFIKSIIKALQQGKRDIEDVATDLGKGIKDAIESQIDYRSMTKYFSDQVDKIAREAAACYKNLVKDLNKAGESHQKNVLDIKESYADLKEQIRTGTVPTPPKSALQKLRQEYDQNRRAILDSHRDTLESLRQDYLTTLGSINASKEKLSSKISGFSGLFENPERKKAYSAAKIMENSQRSAAQVKEFYTLIEQLRKRKVPPQLIEEFVEMGPASVNQIREFLKLTDKQLTEYYQNQKASKSYGDRLAAKQYEDDLKAAKSVYSAQLAEEKARYEKERLALKAAYDKDALDLAAKQKKQYEEAKKRFDYQMKEEKKRYEKEYKGILDRTRHYMAGLSQAIKDGLRRGTVLSQWEINQIAENLTKGVIEAVKQKLKKSSAVKSTKSGSLQGVQTIDRGRLESLLKGVQPLELRYAVAGLRASALLSSSPAMLGHTSSVSSIDKSLEVQNEFNFYQPIETPDQVARAVNRVLTHGLAGDR